MTQPNCFVRFSKTLSTDEQGRLSLLRLSHLHTGQAGPARASGPAQVCHQPLFGPEPVDAFLFEAYAFA
jgi:hypothetical protein